MNLYASHELQHKALRMASEMLQIQERNFGETHIQVAQTKIAMGNFIGACKILLENSQPDEMMVMKCFYLLSHSINKDDSCIPWLRKWLNYLEKNYPSNDLRIAYTLRQMASIYYDLGNVETASTHLQRSLRIYSNNQDHFNMRTIEDFTRHGNTGLHAAYVVCDDYWDIRLLFASSIDIKFDMPIPPNPPKPYKAIQV